MKRTLIISAILLGSMLGSAFAQSEKAPGPSGDDSGHSALHQILFYIPNRVFDLLDPFRARVRVGPGAAVGVRATEAAAVYLGSYVSVFAGLPGPRQAPSVPLPAGLESLSGAQLSVADATSGGGMGPGYSMTECGLSLHALLIGLDLDLDPLEMLDFATGILGIDLRGDDL